MRLKEATRLRGDSLGKPCAAAQRFNCSAQRIRGKLSRAPADFREPTPSDGLPRHRADCGSATRTPQQKISDSMSAEPPRPSLPPLPQHRWFRMPSRPQRPIPGEVTELDTHHDSLIVRVSLTFLLGKCVSWNRGDLSELASRSFGDPSGLKMSSVNFVAWKHRGFP